MTPYRSLSFLADALLATTAAFAGTYQLTPTGVLVRPDTGSVKELRLNAITEAIIQVIGVDDPRRRWPACSARRCPEVHTLDPSRPRHADATP